MGHHRARTRVQLTESQIAAWARTHYEGTGRWPTCKGGPVAEATRETWRGIDRALRLGKRGLPRGTNLSRLLRQLHSDYCPLRRPRLTISQILQWADAFHDRMGAWPRHLSGPIPESPGETWNAVDMALRAGVRSLPGGSSLERLLKKHRGVRPPGKPRLTQSSTLRCADAHRHRTGEWPDAKAGKIPELPGMSWRMVDIALHQGGRGLRGGSSISGLLGARRDVTPQPRQFGLTIKQILHWADAHVEATGRWPSASSGPVVGAPGRTWEGLDRALRRGGLGLPGGSCLSRLLRKRRASRRRLSRNKVRAWADAFFERAGRWPGAQSGPIPEAPGERWCKIDYAMKRGQRGFRAHSTLVEFLRGHGRAARQRATGR